jgi:hypothetical protein
MFRTFGSTVMHRFAGLAIVAAVVSSLAAFGCSSSSDGNTPDSGPVNTTCDGTSVQTLFTAKGCTGIGCHNSTGDSAGLNLTANGIAARLVGVSPTAGVGSIPSSCAGMSKVYLTAGSNPATGLLLDKLTSTPGCGARMPLGGAQMTASEISCVRTWATTLTSP